MEKLKKKILFKLKLYVKNYKMRKKTKKNLLNKLNKTSGWILVALGFVFLVSSLSTFGSEISLFYPIINTLSSVALGFLGIYVLRIEKWAIILSGIYGLALLIINSWIWGLFSGGFRGIIFDVAYIILVINWWISNDK